jgi:outer membrane protein assembly factor BamB
MKYALLLTPLLALPLLAAPKTGDWPSWRGPFAAGSVESGEYPTKWTQATWSYELPGRGVSTPIVWKDRVYVTTPADGQDALLALDKTGKQLWLTKLGPESPPRHQTLASSCNPSPVTDGKAVFARYRSGRLVAVELDGKLRWQINLDAKFGPEILYWDSGCSPVVTDDALIISRIHHGESWVAGFDKKTGAQLWLQKRNYTCPAENDNGYATPVFFTYKGKSAFLLWGADKLTAHSSADGSLLWECGGFNPAGTVNWPTIANIVIHDKLAIVPVGRDDRNQGHTFAVRLDGSGDVTATGRAWQRDDVGVFCCSPVEYKDRIYLLRNRGGLVCLDPNTGKTFWTDAFPRASSSYYASPVIANGILYAAREDGMVFAARVEDKFELLSENPMGERIVASPSLSKDALILRGEKHLFCIAAAK